MTNEEKKCKYCKWKSCTSAYERAVHYVFEDKFGYFVHRCRILTENPNKYGCWYRTIKQYKNLYLIETNEVYQQITWERIYNSILMLKGKENAIELSQNCGEAKK